MDMTGCWRGKLTEPARRRVVAARSVVTTPGYGRSDVVEPGGVMPWAEKTLWTKTGETGPAAGLDLVTGS
jgi:hypothetical protein